MALLFDQNQGSFQDTGSQRSPMKKNTGLMRKEMSKLDEVAPRGHTLAYITPEEAKILNRGGGGVDQEGNQMMGPYGVPMYPGYGSQGYQYKPPKPTTGTTQGPAGMGSSPPSNTTTGTTGGPAGMGSPPSSNTTTNKDKPTKSTTGTTPGPVGLGTAPPPKDTGIFDWAESGKDNTLPNITIIDEEDKINLTESQLKDLEKIDLHGQKSKGKKWWEANFDKPIKPSNFSANALMDIPNIIQGKGFKNVNPFVQDIVDEYMTGQEMLVRRGNVGQAETSGGAFDIAKNIYVGALIATKSQKEPLAKGIAGTALNAIGQLAEVFQGGTIKGQTQDFSDNLDGVAFVTKYPNATREEILQYAEGKALEKFNAQQNTMTSGGFMANVENALFKMVGKDFLIDL